MATAGPVRTTNCANQYDDGELRSPDRSATVEWDLVVDRLAGTHRGWVTVVAPTGRPHTRPVLFVVIEAQLFTTSGGAAVKTRLLDDGGGVSFAASCEGLDAVWTGTASRVGDAASVERIAAAFREKYGWPAEAVGDALDAPYGAPSAGPPPYRVYRIDPVTVHALGTDEDLGSRSTRFEFPATSNDGDAPGTGSVVVAGHLTVDPADRATYLARCRAAIEAARANPDCIDFALGADAVEPARINVYERWRSRAALEAFRGSGPDDAQADMLVGIEVAEFDVPA